MRFTRHALNRLRFHRLSRSEVVELVWTDAGWISHDESGNIAVTGFVRGRGVTVVVAADEPGLIITVIGERRARP